MKNTKTTLMELTKKYCSILRKCAFLNALIIGFTFPTMAKTINGTAQWVPEQYNATTTFTGKIETPEPSNTGSQRMHTIKAYLENLIFIGKWNDTTDNWGNYSGINANALDVTGKVFLKDADISMSADAEVNLDDDEYKGASNYSLSNKYNSHNKVIWNGNVYNSNTDGKNFYDKFYSSLKNANLLQVNDIPENSPLAAIGTEYKKGEIFTIVNTKEAFINSGLIKASDYPEKNNSDAIMLGFRVNGNKYKTLSPEDFLGTPLTKIDPNTSVKVHSGARLKLNRANLAGENSLDEMQEQAKVLEMADAKKRLLSALEKADFKESTVYTDVSNLEVEYSNLWNYLDAYVYSIKKDETGEDMRDENGFIYKNREDAFYSILKDSFDNDVNQIDFRYNVYASQAYNFKFSVQGDSKIDIGNGSRIGKESSGTVEIDNSEINVWSNIKTPILGENDDVKQLSQEDFSSIDHMGFSGNMIIRNNSTINLYTNGGILRTTENDDGSWLSNSVAVGSSGDILINKSTINMFGDSKGERNYHSNVDNAIGTTPKTILGHKNGAIIMVSNDVGTMRLENGSTLNVVGDNNNVFLRNSGFDATNSSVWKKEKKNFLDFAAERALFVNDSTINVGSTKEPNSVLSLWHYDPTIEMEKLGGKIALNDKATVNIYGTLNADIVSISPSVEIGTKNAEILKNTSMVNLFNGANVNGTIYNSNIFAKSKKTNFGGKLKVQNSVLNIDINQLSGKELSLTNSLLVSTVASNGNGSLDIDTLNFNNSKIRINVKMNLKKGQSTTIRFVKGDTGKLKSSDFFNSMYDFIYKNGELKLIRNGNSGMLSLQDLNAATSWLSGDFIAGSPAKMIADTLSDLELKDPEKFAKVIKKLQPTDSNQGHQQAGQTSQQVAKQGSDRMGGNGRFGDGVAMKQTQYDDAEGDIILQVGSETESPNQVSLEMPYICAQTCHVDQINVLSHTKALEAIESFKEGLTFVSSERSRMGAYQNRLEHTIKNLDNVVENTQSAESLIRDTDMASEMVRYSNNNILAQAGQSMLAQANQTNQGVLSLLQ